MKRRTFLRRTVMAAAALPLAVVAARLPLQDYPMTATEVLLRQRQHSNYADAVFVRQYEREVTQLLAKHSSRLRGFGTVTFPRSMS